MILSCACQDPACHVEAGLTEVEIDTVCLFVRDGEGGESEIHLTARQSRQLADALNAAAGKLERREARKARRP